jgi:hypothetical protein
MGERGPIDRVELLEHAARYHFAGLREIAGAEVTPRSEPVPVQVPIGRVHRSLLRDVAPRGTWLETAHAVVSAPRVEKYTSYREETRRVGGTANGEPDRYVQVRVEVILERIVPGDPPPISSATLPLAADLVPMTGGPASTIGAPVNLTDGVNCYEWCLLHGQPGDQLVLLGDSQDATGHCVILRDGVVIDPADPTHAPPRDLDAYLGANGRYHLLEGASGPAILDLTQVQEVSAGTRPVADLALGAIGSQTFADGGLTIALLLLLAAGLAACSAPPACSIQGSPTAEQIGSSAFTVYHSDTPFPASGFAVDDPALGPVGVTAAHVLFPNDAQRTSLPAGVFTPAELEAMGVAPGDLALLTIEDAGGNRVAIDPSQILAVDPQIDIVFFRLPAGVTVTPAPYGTATEGHFGTIGNPRDSDSLDAVHPRAYASGTFTPDLAVVEGPYNHGSSGSGMFVASTNCTAEVAGMFVILNVGVSSLNNPDLHVGHFVPASTLQSSAAAAAAKLGTSP